MKQKIIYLTIFLLFMIQIQFVSAQFTPDEISQRALIEEFLKNAEIVRSKEVGEGVTKPSKLYLKDQDVEMNGIWKNPSGKQSGFLEGWTYEIAAYEMDKLLELNMVPPTVERIFGGKKGSLQFWITSEMSDLDRMNQGISIPRDKMAHWEKRKYLTRAFDCLIANEDRTQQNIRYTKDWRTILIDHSRSFRSSKKFRERLVFGKNGLLAVQLIRRLPRSFVEKVKALDYDSIKQAVGSYLNKKEIEAVLMRKELLLAEIEELIKNEGEANVLY